jgi:hypothetical protein
MDAIKKHDEKELKGDAKIETLTCGWLGHPRAPS